MTAPRKGLRERDGVVRLLTVRQVTDVLALSERQIRSLIAEGALPVVRLGARSLRVHPEDLRTFIEARRGALGRGRRADA